MILHPNSFLKNLHTFQVLYEDTDAFSKVFLISQLEDTFTAGKNAFFIKGTPFLDPGTEVLVEIIDADGKSVYTNPIKLYEESLSRIVSVEINSDTAIGPATLIVMGSLRIMPDTSLLPSEWKHKYNVRWSRTIYLDRRLVNKTPIRLYETPEITVTELLNPYKAPVSVLSTITGSVGTPLTGTIITQPHATGSFQPTYLVRSGQAMFSSSMTDGTLAFVTSTGTTYTSSIKKVWNSTILELTDGFSQSGSYVPFSSINYSLSYVDHSNYVISQYTRSFADINIEKLKTFSGDIEKAKIFIKSVDSPGDYEIISDNIIDPISTVTTHSIATGDPILNYGYVKNQSILDNFWQVGNMTSANY